MSTLFFLITTILVVLEWIAVFIGWRKLEYVAKPGVMLFLLLWLLVNLSETKGILWFGLGIVFSLVGDVFLLVSSERRWFLAGFVAFILAYSAYFLGLNTPPPAFSTMTLGVVVMVIIAVLPPIRRILTGVRQRRLRMLQKPVRAFATVISLMLFSAMMTLFRTDWLSIPAYLVSIGAVLLVASDLLLAWNKFVKPVRRGRLLMMVTYHLGQVSLIAGAISQFGK